MFLVLLFHIIKYFLVHVVNNCGGEYSTKVGRSRNYVAYPARERAPRYMAGGCDGHVMGSAILHIPPFINNTHY